MSRDITGAVSTALQGPVIRPVLIARLDIATDPLTAWTGPGIFSPTGSGDAALDGQIFASVAPILEMTDITEDKGMGGPVTLAVAGHDLDEELLKQIVKDKRQWRGRDAWLWLGLLDPDQKSVLADPFRIKTGVITNIVINRANDASKVSVIIDRDLGNARAAPFRWIDHPRFWPTDTFSTYVTKLANKPQGFTNLNAWGASYDEFEGDGGMGGLGENGDYFYGDEI